jgi:hypothetical protein
MECHFVRNISTKHSLNIVIQEMALRQFALNGWGRYAPIVIIITIKIGFFNYTKAFYYPFKSIKNAFLLS